MPVISGGGGGGGSGLPASWSNDGHGGVTAETDDPASVPLQILGIAGQGPNDFADLLVAVDSSGSFGTTVDSSGHARFAVNDAAGADWRVVCNSGIALKITATDRLIVALPVADPLVAGALWNSGGVVHVSAG